MPGFADDIGKLTPHLRRLARALVSGHGTQAADDLVQETIVLAGRSELPKRGSILAIWCFASLIRLNRFRRQSTRPVCDDESSGLLPFLPKDILRLDVLALEHREVLLLTVMTGLSYPQVADILGTDVATVMTRLTEARDALARQDAGVASARHVEIGEGRRHPAGLSHLRLVK